MSPPTSSADKPPFAAVQNPSQWRFSWEAQSHTSTLRLLLFNPNVKPSAQCRDLELNLLPQHSLLMVSFSGSEETRNRTSVWVPVPRVLIDPESPLHFRAFDDHIEVKLVLLLPVDHPLVSDFDSILNVEENKDELCPLSMDSDLKKLSCMEEVHLYCRNCSTKLTKSLRCFEEMPSVNWRESADNWFGNCCCSFGGLSEELVAKYAKSYACAPGVCLLNTTSVLLCINDIVGCDLPDVKTRQKFESELNSPSKRCLSKVSHEVCEQVQIGCCGNHDGRVPDIIIKSSIAEPNIADNLESETSKEVVDADNLSYTFPAFKIEENKGLMNEISQIVDCDSRCCTPDVLGTSSMVQMNRTKDEHLENQKIFLDGFLGNGFMVRSSGLSKDIRWTEFLCPQCSCLIGTYPCVEDNVSLDGGVRLFKCYISSCIPSNGTNDAFRNYTLDRMFTNQLLESAEDELSFRTIVRDIKTKSPILQIILLNPNSWSCNGCLHPMEAAAKLAMYPTAKVLYSACSGDPEFDSKSVEDWVRKNQADEVYMFSSQIQELSRALELVNSLSPPSYALLQGLSLSSMRR